MILTTVLTGIISAKRLVINSLLITFFRLSILTRNKTKRFAVHALHYLLLFLCLILPPCYSAAEDNPSQAPININTADAETLSTVLKGIGPSKAKAIIAYRESYGGFKSVDELLEIKGIGRSLIARNRELIVLE